MFRFFSCFIFLTLMILTLNACGTRRMTQGEMIFDIAAVRAVADSRVPAPIIRGVQQRLETSIAATQRVIFVPRVTMDVQIDSVAKGLGVHKGRSEAMITVRLSGLENGENYHVASFPVYSFTLDANTANEALAEAIAGRIRYSYSLKIPSIPQPILCPVISAPLAAEPVVIPLVNSKPVIKVEQPAMPTEAMPSESDPASTAEPCVETIATKCVRQLSHL